MRTQRSMSINNSLAHGICNYSCRLCGVNKRTYRGPKAFQTRAVTEQLISRVREAAREGFHIRYIANAGDGEPTLHPKFGEHMDLFGEMIRMWDVPRVPAPEVSVVTNGSCLLRPGVLEAFVRNPLTLIISFPTPEPEAYGEAMAGDPACGAALLEKVVPGIEKAFELRGTGQIERLQFHISPPEREIVRRDFPKTLEFLTRRARAAGVDGIELVFFPATSNRSGLIRNGMHGCDMYRDLFHTYNRKRVDGVRIEMNLLFKRFFPRFREFVDLLFGFDYPCIWNSQLFITADGTSICCNDQAVRNPMGHLMHASIHELVERKEVHLPGRVCAGCDQAPTHMSGSPLATVFGWLACLRLVVALRRRRHGVLAGEEAA